MSVCASVHDTVPLPMVPLILTKVQQVIIQSRTLKCLNSDKINKI